ncbi:MAG: ribbon-helix-helix protein, CopG family [Egibacteraceae bacterium]
MGKPKQVAFQIDDGDLAEIDALASAESRSRADLLRTAVREWLARRREAAVDAALAKGYRDLPQGQEEGVWADLSLQGLEASDLDW